MTPFRQWISRQTKRLCHLDKLISLFYFKYLQFLAMHASLLLAGCAFCDAAWYSRSRSNHRSLDCERRRSPCLSCLLFGYYQLFQVLQVRLFELFDYISKLLYFLDHCISSIICVPEKTAPLNSSRGSFLFYLVCFLYIIFCREKGGNKIQQMIWHSSMNCSMDATFNYFEGQLVPC